MTSQRDALQTFFRERVRGLTAVAALTGAIVVVGYTVALVIVWVLA